jgi:hypothetical protein
VALRLLPSRQQALASPQAGKLQPAAPPDAAGIAMDYKQQLVSPWLSFEFGHATTEQWRYIMKFIITVTQDYTAD